MLCDGGPDWSRLVADKEPDGPEAAILKALQQIAATLPGPGAKAQHIPGAVFFGPQDDHDYGSLMAHHGDVRSVDVHHGVTIRYGLPAIGGQIVVQSLHQVGDALGAQRAAEYLLGKLRIAAGACTKQERMAEDTVDIGHTPLAAVEDDPPVQG